MKKKLIQTSILFTSIFLIGLQASGAEKYSYVPASGYVPDEKTAVLIAEAVFMPIYGEDIIRNEQPFTATLTNDIWKVQGTLPASLLGGVAIAEISKKDARIIQVSHGK